MSKPRVSTDDNISPCAPIFSAYWVGADDEHNQHNKALNAVVENVTNYAARQRQLPRSFAESLVQLMKEQKMTFSSPSAAAACIVGGESNGQIMWITDEGVKLKDL